MTAGGFMSWWRYWSLSAFGKPLIAPGTRLVVLNAVFTILKGYLLIFPAGDWPKKLQFTPGQSGGGSTSDMTLLPLCPTDVQLKFGAVTYDDQQ